MSRRPTGENATVALFPFLAVLMSTMGSLILLLVLISRQARTQGENERKSTAEKAAAQAAAQAAAAEAANAAEKSLARQREDLEWTNDQLVVSRDKTSAELAVQRAHLAHIEEHSDRLRRQIAEAQNALRLLESQSATDEATRVRNKAELEELRRKIAQKEAELREAEKAGMRPQAFAIVPFEGAGATRRRPIYIECRADRIVLQPEGVEFREDDFADGQGPANPLAACVRAAAEHAVRLTPTRSGEQPYPLLLVRPDGIAAYYAARAAMSTWDEEFGYELIDAEWPLEFPPADPQLAELLARTAQDARIRQAMLAKAAPSIRHAPSTATYGVSRSGHGIERLDGGYGGGSSRSGGWSGSAARPGGGTEGVTSRGPRGTGGYGLPGNGSTGEAVISGSPGAGSLGLGGTGIAGAGTGGSYAGSPGLGGPALGAPGGRLTPGGIGGPSATGTRRGDGSGDSATSNGSYARGEGTAERAGEKPGNGRGGRNGSGTNTGDANGGSSQNADSSGSNNSGTGGDGSPFGGSVGGGSSGSNGSSGGGSSAVGESALQQASAAPNLSAVSRSETAMPASLAGKRGADWGLPQKGPNATGLTRPIQVYCSNDRIVVLTDRGGDKPIIVQGRTDAAVDELVNDVWDQVRSWGAPGRNMYWKPQLTMHVAPDGERRFEELKALLDGSGLDVVGKPMVLATPQTINRQPRR